MTTGPDPLKRPASFNGPRLYAALDGRLKELGMSWQELGRQIGVAPSTICRTRENGRMETDGVLAMIGWLGRVPEDFIDGAETPDSECLVKGRCDTRALYEALDDFRRSRNISWRALAAEIGGVSPGMLTHLAHGGRIEVNLMVAAVSKLGRSVGSFTRKR